MSTIRDKSYNNAVDTLQRIGTSFSPAEKIQVIQQTFDEINKVRLYETAHNYPQKHHDCSQLEVEFNNMF